MKIIYDNVIFNLQKAGGITTYWSNLIVRFLRDRTDIYFIENANNNIERNNISVSKEIILSRRKLSFFNRFIVLKLRGMNDRFIFHSSYNRTTSNRNALNVVTVHDFIHEKFYTGPRMWIHRYQKSAAIKGADRIIAVSENTKNDLLTFFPSIDSNKVFVVYNGVSDDFIKLSDNREATNKNYFLFVGSREKYKNFEFIVEFLSLKEDYFLYIVGSKLKKKEFHFLESKLKERWQLYNTISNEKLNELYNNAYALLYLSFYEGFGIPLLEAMRAGCPFIALRASSVPEVAGDAGVLINQLDYCTLNYAIDLLKANRSIIIDKGFEQVKKFSWEKCYEETRMIYESLFTLKDE